MASLLSLAIELLQLIGNEIPDKADLANLRSTCLLLNAAIQPQFFSHVVINITRSTQKVANLQLESLLESPFGISECVRSLEIRDLNPWANPGSYPRNPTARHLKPTMDRALGQAISSMKNLRAVSWICDLFVPEATGSTVIDALCSIPSLEAFELYSSHDDIVIPVERLKCLHRIALPKKAQKAFVEQLDKAIVNCPHLSHLEIHTDPSYNPAFHSLVADLPISKPLRLTHLSLTNFHRRWDSSVLSHLTFLASLKLHYRIPKPDDSDGTDRDISRVWNLLHTAGIHLTELDTNVANIELLNYIASYSGLVSLALTALEFQDMTRSEILAKKFYDVLSVHAKSLVRLSVSPSYSGIWCFSKENFVGVSKCRKITHLLLGLDADDGTGRMADETFAAKAGDSATRLWRSSEQLPHIFRLEMHLALPVRIARNRYNALHRTRIAGMVYAYFRLFDSVDPSMHPREIVFEKRVYTIIPMEGVDGAFKYSL